MKRIFLYILTNLAIVAMVSVVLFLIQAVFGFQLNPNTTAGLLIFSLVVGFTGSVFSLLISRWMALKAVNGELITTPKTAEEQWLLGTIERLSRQWGFKMPQVAVYHAADPNAFATGPSKNRSLIAVSSGLLRVMTKDEIEGVLGHEIAHIGNGDMVTMTLLQGILNTFVIFLSRIVGGAVQERTDMGNTAYIMVILLLQFVFGLFASLILMWFNRYREYHADADSARHVGAPKMIAALQKLERVTAQTAAQEPLPTEVNAFGIMGQKDSLFSTHPSIENRILALQGLKKI